MVIGGETERALRAQPGEVVRLYLTDTADTRVLNALAVARMKLSAATAAASSTSSCVESA